jgi:probable rRNA maturation factor
MKKQKVSPQRFRPQIFKSFGEGVRIQSFPKLERVFQEFLRLLPQQRPSVELRFVHSLEMKELNYRFKKKNRPTDVLSFHSSESSPLLGTIVIDLQTANRQAEDFKHSLEQEILELFCHGLFHLTGMDHENYAEAELMKAYENYLIQEILQPRKK